MNWLDNIVMNWLDNIVVNWLDNIVMNWLDNILMNWLDNIVMNSEVNKMEISGVRRRSAGVLQTIDNSFVVATNQITNCLTD
jgi:hypothetical protein